jgi:ABC-type Fe3+/spermidine/putrescine transport system ATPase subunit
VCRAQAQATLSVRPERIAIAAAGDPADGDNTLPGRIEETIFLGGHVRVRLRGAAGEMVANVPAQAAGAIPPVGAAAVARWPAASTVVFPE